MPYAAGNIFAARKRRREESGGNGRRMNTLEAINKRRPSRSYAGEPVAAEEIHAMLASGMRAPIGSGACDTMRITVVEDAALVARIGQATTDLLSDMMGRPMGERFGAPAMGFGSAKESPMPIDVRLGKDGRRP